MKPQVMTVSDLNNYMKKKVETDEFLNNVYVKGEISNFKHHFTGHMYFTLKDEKSLIKCIMFKTSTTTLNFVPKDGMQVFILGTVGVFERDGVYQIYCKAMQTDGTGDLYKKYEELKNKLEQEGLFLKEHKKKIPFMPKAVGVLTSQTGSVIKDIINVSTRRNPNVNIKLYPIPVQGAKAELKIEEAIRVMNEFKLADVIILARGGGSIEDLWPFNEEITARAIYNSEIPIISAIGHETDFTISDFVADLRAPTPSAGAELAVPNIEEINYKIKVYKKRMKISLMKILEYMKIRYEKIQASKVFSKPLQKINEEYMKIDISVKELINKINIKIQDNRLELTKEVSKLDTLSPLKTLNRGYCIVESGNKVIKTAEELQKGDKIKLKFADGNKSAVIE